MDSKAIIGISVVLNFVAFAKVAQLYIWPRLQGMRRKEALNALAAPHHLLNPLVNIFSFICKLNSNLLLC